MEKSSEPQPEETVPTASEAVQSAEENPPGEVPPAPEQSLNSKAFFNRLETTPLRIRTPDNTTALVRKELGAGGKRQYFLNQQPTTRVALKELMVDGQFYALAAREEELLPTPAPEPPPTPSAPPATTPKQPAHAAPQPPPTPRGEKERPANNQSIDFGKANPEEIKTFSQRQLEGYLAWQGQRAPAYLGFAKALADELRRAPALAKERGYTEREAVARLTARLQRERDLRPGLENIAAALAKSDPEKYGVLTKYF